MIVAHNMVAMNAQRQFDIVGTSKRKSTEKLSSGYRVNRAADDAAGLAISEKMRRQIRGLSQGANNIQEGVHLVQVADGALTEINDILNRMTELSVKAANGTLEMEDRSYIQQEVNALTTEIGRICMDTTYNKEHLFDDPEYYNDHNLITKLVSCESANFGALHESYQSGGYYYAAAYMNFSGITPDNIDRLNGGSFQFNCSQSCNEVFDVTFTTDGTPSSCSNLTGRVAHHYSVDISGCHNGTEVVDAIYSYVSNHLPSTATESSTYNPGGVKVSHSNNLIKQGESLIVVTNSYRDRTAAAAATRYDGLSKSGKINCSTILADPPKIKKDFPIQCSSDVDDIEIITINRISTDSLGIASLNVMSERAASDAITTIDRAMQTVLDERAELGATQNRLEHSYNTNRNAEENTQAAESRIRDTDMATEMVEHAKQNILEQAGLAMMAQANQSNQGVLSLLK